MMDSLITPNQSAHVPNRSMHECILIAHEIFHFLKLKRRENRVDMALKLDLNKAYDRVEWDFLTGALKKMGFHRKWIILINQCISTVSFNALVNGEEICKLRPARGLRQGNRLLPYLFLFAQDALSRLITSAIDCRLLSGFKMGRNCLSISHIFFADDYLLFLKVDKKEFEVISRILGDYCSASGQCINFEKSEVVFSQNCSEEFKAEFLKFSGIVAANLNSKYLGLPISWGRSKNVALSFIYDQIVNKLQNWKQATLSQVG